MTMSIEAMPNQLGPRRAVGHARRSRARARSRWERVDVVRTSEQGAEHLRRTEAAREEEENVVFVDPSNIGGDSFEYHLFAMIFAILFRDFSQI